MLDSLRIRIALKVISSKLPIGVATKYNVPVMLKKIISYVVLVFILTCCTLSSNEYSKKEDDIDEFKSKDLVLSSSRLNSNIDIVFFEDKTAFQKSFLEGIKNGFFILREGQKRNSQINFIDFSKGKFFDCSKILTKTKKIIFLNSNLVDVLNNCNLKNNNNILVIVGLKEKVKLNLNFIDPFYDYVDYLYSSDPEILREESVVLTDRELKAENYFLIEKQSNIENRISNLFEINKSSNRKRELERITQNRIYQTPRFRKDVKKIIINTKEVTAERIIPAINFNLIFEPEIYILPGQLDLWRFSKKEFNSNLKGLEHPIFLNDNFLFDDEFSKKQIQEKLFYALGFDSLLFLGKGINTRFNGLLGKYTKDENRIFITPEKIGFQ
jgi:hypothetical protein